eukprot:Em0016g614a
MRADENKRLVESVAATTVHVIDSSDEDPEHTVCYSESDGACSEESDFLSDTASVAIDVVTLFGNLETLYLLFSKSSKVHSIFEDMQVSKGLAIRSLKRLNTVRWNSRERCVNTFVERHECIILTLDKIRMDNTFDTKHRSDATGLLPSVNTKQFMATMYLFQEIFVVTGPLSRYLQTVNMDICNALVMVQSAIDSLEKIRNSASDTIQRMEEATAADIPSADLAAPFDKHTVPALRWWLLCRGICAPGSWNKKKLIDRINEAVVDNMTVVDVDGSYLYKKYKTLTDAGHVLAPLTAPPPPPSGWVTVSSENYTQVAPDIPTVTVGLVYTYLAGHVGRTRDEGAFRALTRGYAHWASGRLEKLSVNTNNPKYCHIRAAMKPLMKTGVYHAYLLLESDAEGLASILAATCECVAGYV